MLLWGDDEVHRVVKHLKQGAAPQYLEGILDETKVMQSASAAGVDQSPSLQDHEQDPLYDEAVDFVVRARRVSISRVQRRFKIGYNRAASMVEAMEAAGVVSSVEQGGQRDVLMPPPPD